GGRHALCDCSISSVAGLLHDGKAFPRDNLPGLAVDADRLVACGDLGLCLDLKLLCRPASRAGDRGPRTAPQRMKAGITGIQGIRCWGTALRAADAAQRVRGLLWLAAV